ncbi:conserved hypothetical protein [Histoplasma capsulatum H143]|uniref:Uncharacterized protein n=1 Tax=Ajellomyces capsulatus (strain H143) TaxID=544712 RepID=C6HSG9_AJECH|nr:conserved hypothetical protein [Histoplasma capsulatum H143]
MKFLVVFLTLMTASVWAVAIPAPEPEPAVENPNQGEFVAKLDLELQVSGSCISFALYLVLQA